MALYCWQWGESEVVHVVTCGGALEVPRTGLQVAGREAWKGAKVIKWQGMDHDLTTTTKLLGFLKRFLSEWMRFRG